MENKKKVFIGYVPVVHKGFLNLFRNEKIDEIYVLSRELIKKLTESGLEYLARDIRAVSPFDVMYMIRSLKQNNFLEKNYQVGVIEEDSIPNLFGEECDIYLASDEVGHKLNELYFAPAKIKVTFVQTFLRWDKLISTQELEIAPHRIISENEIDAEFMEEAFSESEKSSDWWRHVGCVVVTKTGKKVFGHNHHMPHEHTPYIEGDVRSNFNPGERNDLGTAIHAEGLAISTAARNGVSLDSAILYVTTFPCQNCARLIVTAGIKKVLYRNGYSVQDAERIFNDAGVEIVLVK